MTITDADLEWLNNVNTMPGPNAGRSIDPSKPGPDDARPAALAQSDAGPVVWRWRLKGDSDWSFLEDDGPWPDEVEAEPLYTASSRPDASAGLIEALERIQQRVSEATRDTFENDVIWIYEECRRTLRSRAADRSGK